MISCSPVVLEQMLPGVSGRVRLGVHWVADRRGERGVEVPEAEVGGTCQPAVCWYYGGLPYSVQKYCCTGGGFYGWEARNCMALGGYAGRMT